MNKIYWNTDTDVVVDLNNVIDRDKIPESCEIYLNFGVTTVDFGNAHDEACKLVEAADAEVIKCQYKKEEGAKLEEANLMKLPVIDMNGNEIMRDIQSLMYATIAVKRMIKYMHV